VKPDVKPAAMMQPTPTGFTLAGPLTIATASLYIDAARTHWPQDGDAIIDFTGVTEADSAALALIFKWQRDAEKKGRKIRCLNIPANVIALAKLYGVDALITA
jgi:phospholipid transport system transporter-binding protein